MLILGGLAKKLLIADYLVDAHRQRPLRLAADVLVVGDAVGIIAYSVQIYCDFSAYADIAIGISLLLGFELPANFDAPYTARTIQDFWRRWHITLSQLAARLPVHPARRQPQGQAGAPTPTSLSPSCSAACGTAPGGRSCSGGFMHGTGLAVERARMDVRHSRGLPEPGRTAGARALQRLLVFAFVSVAWVFFRAESMGNAFAVLWRLIAGLGSIGAAVTLPVVGLAILGIAIQYVPRRTMEGLEAGFSRIGWLGQGLALALALFLIDVLGPAGPAEFLYFKF